MAAGTATRNAPTDVAPRDTLALVVAAVLLALLDGHDALAHAAIDVAAERRARGDAR